MTVAVLILFAVAGAGAAWGFVANCKLANRRDADQRTRAYARRAPVHATKRRELGAYPALIHRSASLYLVIWRLLEGHREGDATVALSMALLQLVVRAHLDGGAGREAFLRAMGQDWDTTMRRELQENDRKAVNRETIQ